jgi:hypothetical protein
VDVDYRTGMTRQTDEEDGCHPCLDRGQGRRTAHRTWTQQGAIKAYRAPGRASIHFARDGSYTLALKLGSAALDGTLTSTVERRSEGSCDVEQTQRETSTRPISAVLVADALKERGSPLQHQLIAHPPPVRLREGFPEEETVIEAEWNLSRD